MKFIKNVVLASLATMMAASAVQAASFDAYSMMDQKSKRLVLVVSFAGGDQITEAQFDAKIPEGFKLVSAKAKFADSICIGFDGNKIRVVPPSGGTKALSSASTDICSFTFAAEKGKTVAAKPVFEQSFIECAAVSGIKSCNANIADISQ